MAKLENFKGSVPISSGLCPIGDRGYPLVQAHDIQVDEDGTRLDEKLESIGSGGGGNANFIFADSVEELPDPSTVPEDTVGLVPSIGASGGDTTELEQQIADAKADIEALDQRVEGNEESIRDLYYKVQNGGGLPPVTEADNGKFLRVVDGAIALVALQDVSEEGA